MKNKVFFLIAIIVVSVSFLNAQNTKAQIGFKAGINFSNLYDDTVEDSNTITGINFGMFAKLPLTSSIAIQPEVYLTTKGAKVTYNNSFAAGTVVYHLNYVEVPVLVVINVTKNFNIHAGPYVAYLVDGKVKNESNVTLFDFENNIDKNEYERIDYGLAGGIAFDFHAFSFGARYNYGLAKVGKETTYNEMTYTFPNAKNSVASVYVSVSIE
jgi:Outer membrane protein beta-barrel domain